MFKVFRVNSHQLPTFPVGWHIGVGMYRPNVGSGVSCTPLCDSGREFYLPYSRVKTLEDFDNKHICAACTKELVRRRFGKTFENESRAKERHSKMASYLQYAFSMLLESRRSGGYHEDKATYEEGSYPFIPHGTLNTLTQFDALKRTLPKEKRWSGNKGRRRTARKFLDAGCGVGNILLLARATSLARYYHGLEYFDDTYKDARDFLCLDRKKPIQDVKVFQQDILKFENYGDYDIIYYYCPFNDGKLEIQFEELVEDSMRVGAVLVANLKRGSNIEKDGRFERLPVVDNFGITWNKENIFIKVSDGPRETSQLKEKRHWHREDRSDEVIRKKYGE